MPGYGLELNCPCGFRKKDVWVGVTDGFIHHSFAICLECKKIVILQKKPEGEFPKHCHMCGMKLTMPDDPGAWGPAKLQRHFPGEEPWMVNDSYADEIRILCPRCGNLSLRFEICILWD